MRKEDAIKLILGADEYFKQQSSGYKSWGKVNVLQVAIKISSKEIVFNDPTKPLSDITNTDIKSDSSNNTIYNKIFSKRKNVDLILLTQQEYASQVKKEIPPILDDQAQLLGVTVRIAKSENDFLHSLNGRFASILPDGNSLCLGSSLEDAYVAAQLLEKTSKAFVEAEFIGGAKSINKIEAWAMQKFYQFKYSKEASKNK